MENCASGAKCTSDDFVNDVNCCKSSTRTVAREETARLDAGAVGRVWQHVPTPAADMVSTKTATTVAAILVLGVLVHRTLLASFESATLSSWASSGRMANQHAVVTEVAPRPTWEEAQRFLHPMRHEPQEPQASAQIPVAAAVEVVTAVTTDTISPPPPPPPPEQQQQPALTAAPTSAAGAALPAWMKPEVSGRALAFNAPGQAALASVEPRGTTMHFTFGTSVMMDFVKNWLHFVQKAGLSPLLVGAADATLLKTCTEMGVPAAGIIPELDVWTYKRKPKRAEVGALMKAAVLALALRSPLALHDRPAFSSPSAGVRDEIRLGIHSAPQVGLSRDGPRQGAPSAARLHSAPLAQPPTRTAPTRSAARSQVAFLWELLQIGFSVLISDLDVVWLNGHWQVRSTDGHRRFDHELPLTTTACDSLAADSAG